MATIDRSNELDTRGIPRYLDPRKFYEYAISKRLTQAKGLEWIAIRLIPLSLMKSFAIALDPYSMIRLKGTRVTQANRSRSRSRTSVLDQRSWTWDWLLNLKGTIPNWNGHLGLDSPYLVDELNVPDIAVTALTPQPALSDRSKDTTRRTRGPESELGEFEKQSHLLLSSSRKFATSDLTDIRQFWPDGSNPQRKEQRVRSFHSIEPSAAILSVTNYDTFRNAELSVAYSLIDDHSMRMFKDISPQRRKYTLARNLIELRDVKRSVLSLQKAALDLKDLAKNIPNGYKSVLHSFNTNWKDIPNEYLSYHFGWRQLYRDTMDLLVAPDRITKQINFLIRRNGKESTYRLRRVVNVPSTVGVPGFEYYITSKDIGSTTQTEVTRKAEMRLVMNAIFEFPDVMLPSFRMKTFIRQLGVVPTPTDLYNLVPWTWLVDWFTGLGNYVDLIDNVNSDYKLINWAMITAELSSHLVTDFNSDSISTTSYQYSPGPGAITSQILRHSHHQSRCELKTIVRKDLAGALPNVVPYTDVSRLTPYQYSILGALISQRTKFGK